MSTELTPRMSNEATENGVYREVLDYCNRQKEGSLTEDRLEEGLNRLD